jgi:hypothetical protein
MRLAIVGRSVLWVVAGLLAATAFFFMTGNLRSDPLVLQNYEVPTDIAEEVRAALAGALYQGDIMPPLGRATLMPNGRLVVSAPASVQRGVARIIHDITENKPGPTPTIGFEVWAVAATPGGAAQASAGLAELESALEVIRKAKGPMNFELLEKLSTTARSGAQDSNIRGAVSKMQVRASLRNAEDDKPVVAAKIQIRVSVNPGDPEASLEAQTEMRPGELLVIGQSGLANPRPSGNQAGTPQANRQIYYIVRASL